MKRIIAILLACLMAVGVFAGCGNGSNSSSTPNSTASTDGNNSTPNTGATGKVYYLNVQPEADEAWQTLAKQYTDETGVEVKVVTAASGTYGDTLTAEMAKSAPPTMFNCGNEQELINWGDYCLDLTGTDILNEMSTEEFNLVSDGAVKSIGFCYEAFGIIVNKALLEQAGHSIDEIKDFASLKAVAEDIHGRAADLGFDAFASAGLDPSSSWRFSGHLANMPLFYEFRDDNVTSQPATITGAYLDNYRNIWDLYINNSSAEPTSLTSATGDMSQAEFGTGKAVFWQQGTWEYANITGEQYGMDPANLEMIPIYCGVDGEEKAGLCCGTERRWAVNSKASEEDQKATMDFMKWIVTSEAGTTMMAEHFGPCPFKSAKQSENVFFKNADDHIANGDYVVTWDFNYTPNVDSWRASVVSALAAYSADQTDANWDAVKTAFVDGWANEYKIQNGG